MSRKRMGKALVAFTNLQDAVSGRVTYRRMCVRVYFVERYMRNMVQWAVK